jgi:hypothetical protein
MHYELLIEAPVPVWVVTDCDTRPPMTAGTDEALYVTGEPSAPTDRYPLFRGVSLDRFLTVFTTGVDVEPTDAPIYCSDFDKAWEYGGSSIGVGPRLIYALDQDMLERTFQTLPSDAAPAEIEALRTTYPHHHEEHTGSLRFSRIDRYLPGSEIPYAYWIPGNARDALMAIFLLGVERDAVVSAFQSVLGHSTAPGRTTTAPHGSDT